MAKEGEEVLTTRQEIMRILEERTEPTHVDTLVNELSEMRPENLINDINHVLKSLKTKGKKFKIHPPVCRICNFVFKSDKLEINAPSKCPECRSGSIRLPILEPK